MPKQHTQSPPARTFRIPLGLLVLPFIGLLFYGIKRYNHYWLSDPANRIAVHMRHAQEAKAVNDYHSSIEHYGKALSEINKTTELKSWLLTQDHILMCHRFLGQQDQMEALLREIIQYLEAQPDLDYNNLDKYYRDLAVQLGKQNLTQEEEALLWKAVLLSFDYKAKNPPYGDTSYDAMLRYLAFSRLYLYGHLDEDIHEKFVQEWKQRGFKDAQLEKRWALIIHHLRPKH